MTDATLTPGRAAPSRARPAPAGASRRAVDRWLLPIFIVLAIGLPDPADRGDDRCSRSTTRPGRFNFVWGEFSLDGLAEPVRAPGPRAARRPAWSSRSLVDDRRDDPRHAHRARPVALPRSAAARRTNLLIFLPMATPEIVLGAVAADAVRRRRPRAVQRSPAGCSSRSASRRSSSPTSCSTSASWS